LGLIYATKETFLLAVMAILLALVATCLWQRSMDKSSPAWRAAWNTKHACVALAVAAVVSLLLFTSCFTNPHGPIDSIRTYLPWLKRAGGESPHVHPWWFYLGRLAWFKDRKGPIWSEGLILILAVIGAVAALSRSTALPGNRGLARFLVFYAFFLTGAYSAISYKTPWCLLGFLQPLILLAGVGAAVLVAWVPGRTGRVLVGAAIVGWAGQLAWQAIRASYVLEADRRNPYVYAQTSPDLLNLVQKVQELAEVHPDKRQMLVKVMVPDNDYWPLPWYLRHLKRVGWWGQMPADPYAPVMIVGAQFRAALDDKSDKAWLMPNYFELRPKTFLELYVKDDLWKKYLETRPPAP
jgi:predicted membrane-bound mannosyltransferase